MDNTNDLAEIQEQLAEHGEILAKHEARHDVADVRMDKHEELLKRLRVDQDDIREWLRTDMQAVNASIQTVTLEAFKAEPPGVARNHKIMAFITGTSVSFLIVAIGVIALLLGNGVHIG